MKAERAIGDMMKELIIDTFAGGGGASLGIELAIGRSPDVAINHDPGAIEMHKANHPNTLHLTEDVWKASPYSVTKGQPVGLLWASPDCCHFSRAKGAKPVKKEIRSLAWVVIKWAVEVQPRVIILENVREFEDWGPLIPQYFCEAQVVHENSRRLGIKIGKKTPVVPCGWKGTADKKCPRCGAKAKPVLDDDRNPVLVPDPTRKGHSFRRWAGRLRNLGYEVQWRVMNAADYGAPTHRRRLFLVARNDGQKIVWPEPTHGDPKKVDEATLFGDRLEPWRTAAECIDWTIPCPSIFDRKKALAPNTLKRIAMGIKRYVLENPKPFIVQVNHGGDEFRGQGTDEPLPTVTGKHGYGLVVPHVTKFRGGSIGSGVDEPLPTVTSGAGSARPAGAAHAMGVVIAQLAHGSGPKGTTFGEGRVNGVDQPLGTVHAGGNNHALVAATMVQTGYGEREGQSPRCLDLEKPLGTCVNGQKHALVAAMLKHFGGVVGHEIDRPASTITAIDHHSLVVGTIAPYVMTNTSGHPGASVEVPLPTQTTGNQQFLAAANLVHLNRGPNPVTGCDEPTRTITASGNHAALVYSFLVRYFGTAIGQHCTEPLFTITGKDRFGLVYVMIAGEPWVIVDIGMRMLIPRELALAQGFSKTYILTGTKSNQVARIGNSVSPVHAKAIVAVNYKPAKAKRKVKAS